MSFCVRTTAIANEAGIRSYVSNEWRYWGHGALFAALPFIWRSTTTFSRWSFGTITTICWHKQAPQRRSCSDSIVWWQKPFEWYQQKYSRNDTSFHPQYTSVWLNRSEKFVYSTHPLSPFHLFFVLHLLTPVSHWMLGIQCYVSPDW